MSTRSTGIGSFGACRALIREFRASAANCLLAAGLLAALPLQVMAQTPGVSIQAGQVGQYVSKDEGETVDVIVRRTGDNSNALIVNYSIASGGGPADLPAEQAGEGDYTSIPTSHEFSAGNSEPHKFSITINDDDPYEPNEYFTLTASGTYQDGGSPRSFSDKVIVRIKENDERYLTLLPVSDSALVDHPEFMAKEGGTGNDNQLTIMLNDTLPYNLDINYTVGEDPHTTAASSDDFTMKDGKAQITSGSMSTIIDIGIVDDNRDEPTEYFTLKLRTPGFEDPGNALGTFNPVSFWDSKLPSQPLSVAIMDNDTATTGGIVYLRGEGPSGPGVIDKFPSTRREITEGRSTIITAEIAGTAPSSNIKIPLKFDHYPDGEATSDDYSIPESITIMAGKNSGSVTLTITDDDVDERYRELLVVEIDEKSTNFPVDYTKGRTFGSK